MTLLGGGCNAALPRGTAGDLVQGVTHGGALSFPVTGW
jgi:hypothetical protein